MAGPRTDNHQVQALQTEVALLEQRQSALEHALIGQNAGIKAELGEVKAVLREIHDKIDSSILAHTETLATHAVKIEAATSEIARVDKRISRFAATISATFLAIIGSVVQWFMPGKV
jgi:6-pyruvoyl-tetrahydropterin synthase